mgnify:CR=1 FL=1
MSENKLFRKTALETVSNPEQLDQHIRVTKPFAWVILIAIISFVFGVGIWAFTGNISSGVDITGIVFSPDGVWIENSVVNGRVSDVLVGENESVDKGDVMAVIPDEELLAQIKAVKSQNGSSTTMDALRYQYMINSFVTASRGGIVNSVPSVGDTIAEGQQVTVNYSEENMSGSKEIITYIPQEVANSLNIGGDVQISISGYPREEYGYILGKITSIGNTVVTEETINKDLGTTKYNEYLISASNCVRVVIRLNVDSSTRSGFECSNQKGGQTLPVEIGTLCSVKFIFATIHPISMFIS